MGRGVGKDCMVRRLKEACVLVGWGEKGDSPSRTCDVRRRVSGFLASFSRISASIRSAPEALAAGGGFLATACVQITREGGRPSDGSMPLHKLLLP